MASYTKSVTFSSTELNSSTTLNITDLIIDESLQSISLVSSLVLGRDSPNSVSFAVSDGSTNLGSAAFNVILDAFNLNASDFTISSSYNSHDIAYGNGKYVLALYNTKYFAYSTDGNSFSTGIVYSRYGNYYTDTVYPVSIIYGNNRFIMHSGQYVYYSSDGSKWTSVSIAGYGAYNYRASFSLYGNGIFVLSLVNQPYMYYSTTGTSWTSVSVTAATYTGAAYGAEKFVYITADGTTYYSSNGSSWSTGSIGNGSNWNTLCYGNDRFVAISTDGSVAISTDGLSWTYYSGKLTAKTWISVEYGNGMFVAIANNSNVLAASFDGITWYETTIEESNRAWQRVRFANNIFWGLANSSSSGKKFNPELLFKLDPTENIISTNNHTIKNSSLTVTRSEIPTVNSGELGVTLTLEKTNTFTLTQKYYIDGTTTSIKDTDVTNVEKGSSWAFGDYPSKITIGDDEYVFSSVSGDDASGTNITSNKERIIYYTYVLKTFTLTQNYYINGTTTALQDSTVTSVTEGNNWSFSDYPSKITIGDDEYVFSSVSGDDASGTNISSNKVRNVYYTYVLKTFTLTQKYYIKGTTTSLQSDTVINVTEGDSWAFGSYPSTITVGNDTYAFDSVSGDESSGTNLDGNKERIVYYTYVLKTFTLTQKYYIKDTTTSLQSDTVINVTEGDSWAFGDYPTNIIIGDNTYAFDSISGDKSSGTNLDGNKERIVYYTYVPKVYTLTQKYYIKGTTTSLQSDTVINVTEGDSWAFGSYPSTITVGNDTYAFDSVSGDDASGMNINSNKERIIYYTYVLKTFTLTQKYYIDGTTTPIQDSTITTATEGSDWAFGDYPTTIINGNNEYIFSYISGDDASGTNINSNKERIVYYICTVKNYTISQKYYIKDTVTSIKATMFEVLVEGSSWQFESYPENITYNGNTYVFDSIIGDDASGTNIDSNKERIVYYTLDDTYMRAFMMSDLYNDTNMCYIREYFLDYNVLNENPTIILSNLINTHKIYKIKVIYKNIIDNIIEFNINDIKFIMNGLYTIGSVDTDITIENNNIILTHSNTTMNSGSIIINLYCRA